MQTNITKMASIESQQSLNTLPKMESDSILEYAEEIALHYTRKYDAKARKARGQFLTPKQISSFMAELFEPKPGKVRLLDPGAGTGMLTAALWDRLTRNAESSMELVADVYENDSTVLPFLESTLLACKQIAQRAGCRFDFNIYDEDYILDNYHLFKDPDLFSHSTRYDVYDYVISNPPYYKLNKNSSQSLAMNRLVSGQPNVYAFFMAISVL